MIAEGGRSKCSGQNGGDVIYFGLLYEHVDFSNCQRVYSEANEIAEALK